MITRINEWKRVNETNAYAYHMMSGVIPPTSKWFVSSINGINVMSFQIMDKTYGIRPDTDKWFKDRVGKTIKFKYEKSSPMITLPEEMDVNESTHYGFQDGKVGEIVLANGLGYGRIEAVDGDSYDVRFFDQVRKCYILKTMHAGTHDMVRADKDKMHDATGGIVKADYWSDENLAKFPIRDIREHDAKKAAE